MIFSVLSLSFFAINATFPFAMPTLKTLSSEGKTLPDASFSGDTDVLFYQSGL